MPVTAIKDKERRREKEGGEMRRGGRAMRFANYLDLQCRYFRQVQIININH
jgi:hypothetical protein